MLSWLKKNKTLRSMLGAVALFTAGAPTVTEAASKPPQKITQNAEIKLANFVSSYMPLCEQLEGNLPYCYKDKGALTTGCGVHFKDFKNLENLTVIKVTPKKGCFFSLEQKKRLLQMADANWNTPVVKAMFPEVAKVENVKVKNCMGSCPKNTDKKWGGVLFLMPSKTLDKINQEAINFYVDKAYYYHPNLFKLPPSARLVIVDLMYNLGYEKYLDEYPKFQAAVRNLDLTSMRDECGSSNKRRDTIRKYLIDSALLVMSKGNKMSGEQLCRLHRAPAVKKMDSLSPACEPVLWAVMDDCTMVNKVWRQKQLASLKYGKNKTKSL